MRRFDRNGELDGPADFYGYIRLINGHPGYGDRIRIQTDDEGYLNVSFPSGGESAGKDASEADSRDVPADGADIPPENGDSLLSEDDPFLEKIAGSILLLETPDDWKGISSTAVRETVRQMEALEKKLAGMVPEEIIEMILRKEK